MPELLLKKPDGTEVAAKADSSGALVTSGSGGGGGGAVTVADGADSTQGAIADAAVAAGASGSLSAKLRRLTTDLDANKTSVASVDTKTPSKGAATIANSSPVNIASDQTVPVSDAITSLGHGSKAVTTAGTALALAASTVCRWVTVEAYRSNTGYIAVGGPGVIASAAGTGVTLGAGDSSGRVAITNLSAVFIDATVSGEGVRFTYGV